MKTITYVLPSYWASYLINDDHSGLDREEKREIEAWVERQGLFDCCDVGDDYFSWHNDVNDLGGQVAEFTFFIKE